ncbi:hypothetical protein DY000_02060339 [Brassica cretica]|uniref:F-box domain-containing protein n=1 Tax=Brassica cretica TaxID=69181 RepID=A0ABQ7AS25_BRACR|nr:hypothetical protein DY000_02060339 [Brassica cretica]
MNSIPIDLFHDIFSRLPAKSIGRFRCVSEEWRSILCSEDFTELFITKSSTDPSLLFAMKVAKNNEFRFFSSPQLHSQNEKSTLAACFKLKLPEDMPLEFCSHASGLFCFRHMPPISKKEYTTHVICNPSVGQSVFLPKLGTGRDGKSFLGFDPIDKVFKVLSSYSSHSSVNYILTLGTAEMRWRRIHCPLSLYPLSEGICISGVVYYLARKTYETYYIVCFDVRSEIFEFLHADFIDFYATRLINYEGQLGLISWPENSVDASMALWVLEDGENWSEHAFTLPGDKFSDVACNVSKVSVVGVTAIGEIVLMKKGYYDSDPFKVFYFHPKQNTVKHLEAQGFETFGRVYAFVGHVEDLTLMKCHQLQQDRLKFDMKYHQLQKDVVRFEKINKFAALSLLEDV